MKSEADAELDQTLCQTAAGSPRLLSALRTWRGEMPDVLLRAALSPEPTAGMVQVLKVETDRVSHRQLLAHLHFNLSGHLRDHPLEPALRTARLRNGLRNKKLLLERNEIMARLYAGGLVALVFKGADLAYSVYPDACCRVVGDIDLLVDETRYDGAVKALLAEGWIPEDSMSLKAQNWSHPEFGVTLDVQIHVSHHARWPGADQLYFNHSVTRRDVAGGEISTLCPEHALVQICAHGIAQNFYPPVRWAADAVWILKSAGHEFDWDLVLAAVHNSQSAPILSVALDYLRLGLGLGLGLSIDIPHEVLSQMQQSASRQTFRTAWSYRLDLPIGRRERISLFTSRLREGRPDDNLLCLLGRLPDYLRKNNNTSSAIGAVGSLARKAILNKYD